MAHIKPPYLQSRIQHNEILLTTFFITVLVHAAIIFGVSFHMPDPPKPRTSQTLDIVLVKTKAEKAPENPDFLAQAIKSAAAMSKTKPGQPVKIPVPVDPVEMDLVLKIPWGTVGLV